MIDACSQEQLPLESLKQFINSYYLTNRTIASSDIAKILDAAEELVRLPLKRHRFRTGEEHGTWIVPPLWDIKDAWLKDSDGNLIASYKDHPLFVSPYSMPIRTVLSKDELRPHVFSDPAQPDAFLYNWRYAMDARLRLKDWSISLPERSVQKLGPGPFEVCIEADVTDGDMLVGEITLEGEREDTLLFLADYCHPGQVNDSFSGLAVLLKVMHDLSKLGRRQYTYKLLILPETIGSTVYIASDPARLKTLRGAVFVDTVAWGENWFLKSTRDANTYMDLLTNECLRAFPMVSKKDFFNPYGNDEMIFDSVQANVPSLSLHKYPFAEYHSSLDEPSRINDADLALACRVLMHMVDVIEKDRTYRFTHTVPFWMSRFDLFADDVYNPVEFERNFNIVYRYLDGQTSTLKIADMLNLPFEGVHSYIAKMAAYDLVRDQRAATFQGQSQERSL